MQPCSIFNSLLKQGSPHLDFHIVLLQLRTIHFLQPLLTCPVYRRRHIKCSGEKPICSKCQKASRLCEYTFKRPTPDASTGSIRFKAYSPKPTNALSKPKFSNEVEHCGFDHFLNISAHSLGPGIGWLAWGQCVLQISEQNTTVRYGLIALGTLHRCKLGISDFHGGLQNRHLLEFSYLQYGEALHQIQDRVRIEDHLSSLHIMLLCTLFAIFEFVERNDVAAGLHLRADLTYLRNLGTVPDLLENTVVFRGQMSETTGLSRTEITRNDQQYLHKSLTKAFSFLDFWSSRWADREIPFPEISLLDGLIVEATVQGENETRLQLRCFEPLESRIWEFIRAARHNSICRRSSPSTFSTAKS